MPNFRFLTVGSFVATIAWMASAQIDIQREVECCDMTNVGQQVVFVGEDPSMSFDELAAYCGPILWFSPDEPLLRASRRQGMPADLPMAFPFQESDGTPVVYYRVRKIISKDESAALQRDPDVRGESTIDIDKISGIELDYFFYYPSEEGFGGHQHDVESVEMAIAVVRQPDCTDCRYALYVYKVTAKAHGVLWYDNTLTADTETRFPMTILVEEGKHASCTDKNGDGYYTPGYDVNERVNDAWGVRDVLRTGALYTGGYQGWLTKVRNPRDRVFPPLPLDSPLRESWLENGEYMPQHSKYEVRPFPSVEEALAGGDESIRRFVEKGHEEWPYVVRDEGIEQLGKLLDGEEFVKSVSIAARFDDKVGVSFVFPLFVFKHFNDPVSGGWIVNRIYLKDKRLRDLSWQLLYTPSASRWVDHYISAGAEWDDEGTNTTTYFASEMGLKFRFDLSHTPLGVVTRFMDFWGVRTGIRYRGYKHFSELGFAVEVGAGTF